MDGHSNRVYCVKYNYNYDNQLISGGWDDTLQIWDDRVTNSHHYLYGPHICGDAIDIDTQHNHLITGSWRKNSNLQVIQAKKLNNQF
jgi:COMPASS component SWD3